MTLNKKHFNVIIIGGGATGAATARDCARRGLSTLLVEQNQPASAATGRNHGLLHSGARYAVSDPHSANECITENNILQRIAPHCINITDGLFITTPDDDPSYQQTLLDACQRARIPAELLTAEQALQIEPAANPQLLGAVKVPDHNIDPFLLTAANLLDAQAHGAQILTQHAVTDFQLQNHKITAIRLYDKRARRNVTIHADIVINATGIWAQRIAALAGANITMYPDKGTLLIFNRPVTHVVLNRCRPPANADILVPDRHVCVLGTTSTSIPLTEIDHVQPTPTEVSQLLSEGAKLVPALSKTRVLRAYSGVRPLVADRNDPSGRSISRGIVCIDHQTHDGIDNLITITGGKLITCRLMAQQATDLACQKLNVSAACDTHLVPLPTQAQPSSPQEPRDNNGIKENENSASSARDVPREKKSIVCECNHVTLAQIEQAVATHGITSLNELRRINKLGMGNCQGKVCAARAASLLAQFHGNTATAADDLARFLDERWKGVCPVTWGENLREAQITANIYRSLCAIDPPESLKTDANEKYALQRIASPKSPEPPTTQSHSTNEFDVVIVGGGLAALTAGIALTQHAKRVAILSSGIGTLQINPGSFELLGYIDGQPVENPLEAFAKLPPTHPYAKLHAASPETLAQQAERVLADVGIEMTGSYKTNHQRLSPMGNARPAWLTLADYLTHNDLQQLQNQKLALVNITGYLDQPTQFLLEALQRQAAQVHVRDVSTDDFQTLLQRQAGLRSSNIAKALSSTDALRRFADALNHAAADADIVLLPAIVDIDDTGVMRRLKRMVDVPIKLIATLPPSLAGARMHQQLRHYFSMLGGAYVTTTATAAAFAANRVTHVFTGGAHPQTFEAAEFILATGAFASGGLHADFNQLSEPVFGVDLDAQPDREQWSRLGFFSDQPYMHYGVATDRNYCCLRAGSPIDNLHAIGSILSGSNRVLNADASGIAMFTALDVTHQIVNPPQKTRE